MQLKKTFQLLFLLNFLMFLSCDSSKSSEGENGVSSVLIPSLIETHPEGLVTLQGKGFRITDIIQFQGDSEIFSITAEKTTDTDISFYIPKNLKPGSYFVKLVRGDKSTTLGTTIIKITVKLDIPDQSGKNIKGKVYCDGVGVPGVIVSDGYQLTTTDSDGIYYLDSKKAHGYVFISIPKGYDVACINTQAQFWQKLDLGVTDVEEKNFELYTVDNSDHTLLVMGDMHLANRNDDRKQFSTGFMTEAKALIEEHRNSNKKIYAITVGDLTWELYWYSNNYGLNEYLDEIKSLSIPVFNTIGNHDHDMLATGDWDTAVKYKQIIGPTYYSFNLGNIHYVVLDNVDCTNNGTEDGRNYIGRVTQDQIDWLKQDLKHISKTTTVVVAMHVPLYDAYGKLSLSKGQELIDCFEGYQVHFLTGHTHNNYNVEVTEKNIFEHNVGAICATWWWTGKLSNNQICKDGTAGGYGIWNINGNDIKWTYKAIGEKDSYQFRCYDLNKVHITAAEFVPNGSDASKNTFELNYAGGYQNKRNDNYIYINIWNWDPAWKLEVRENGLLLDYKAAVAKKDPLHIISYEAKRLDQNNTPTSSFVTDYSSHIFELETSSPNSDLEIAVTDRFGNIYKETMKRPKDFGILMK